MKLRAHALKFFVYCLATLMTLPSGALAQAADAQGAHYTREELAQMLAPIALYPDALLAQILMASTYPIEVVQASRWIEKNPGLKGDALDAALQDQQWDVSVKSMTHFPDILNQMSDRIEDTSRLGDAFLAQEASVMDMVQELREQARAQGNLKSTPEQKVIVQEKVIVIEPASPEVIYVPTYNPAVVYGPWWYPAYPPYRPYYPYYAGVGFVSFTAGFFVGAAVANWCSFGWHHHRIDVDIHRTVNFNRNVNIYRGRGYQPWHHNPHHRKGVPYRDRYSRERFGGRPPSRTRDARYGDNRGYNHYNRYNRSGGNHASGNPRARDFDRGGNRATGNPRARDFDRGGAPARRDRTPNRTIDPLNSKNTFGNRPTGTVNRPRQGANTVIDPLNTKNPYGNRQIGSQYHRGAGSAGSRPPVSMDRGHAGRGQGGGAYRPPPTWGQKRPESMGRGAGGPSSAFGGASSRGNSARASQRGQFSRERAGGGRHR